MNSPEQIRVLGGEDQPFVREGILRVLEEGGFDVVGTAVDAVDLVRKGADRERAGTPAAAEIDAAFADVLPAGPARDWLNFYRPKAAKP